MHNAYQKFMQLDIFSLWLCNWFCSTYTIILICLICPDSIFTCQALLWWSLITLHIILLLTRTFITAVGPHADVPICLTCRTYASYSFQIITFSTSEWQRLPRFFRLSNLAGSYMQIVYMLFPCSTCSDVHVPIPITMYIIHNVP